MEKTEITNGSTIKPDNSNNKWVVDILKADHLRLAESSRAETYGRAKLGKATKILMWAMRVYVVLSFVLIIAQIYISLHSKS
jgi:hypothetical protein